MSGADPFAVGLGAALDLFLAAKAAEGVSPRTIEWYRMINGRAVRRFGPERPLDGSGRPSCGPGSSSCSRECSASLDERSGER